MDMIRIRTFSLSFSLILSSSLSLSFEVHSLNFFSHSSLIDHIFFPWKNEIVNKEKKMSEDEIADKR